MAVMGTRAISLAAALMVGLVLIAGPYAGPARACSCAGVPSVEEGLRGSDAVFSGEMVRGGVQDPDPEDGTMIGGIEFRVDRSWKGVSGDSAVVYGQATPYYGKLEEGQMYTENSCAYLFEKGRSYLIYASRYEDGFQVGGCDRTAPLASADRDLDALGSPTDRLTDTGGPPLSLVGVLVATAALLISARTFSRWAGS